VTSSVAIPIRMKHLKVDARGFPVPVGVLWDDDGKPHFAVNDERWRLKFIRDDLCSICGGKLLRGRWFVGGAKSAYHPRGAYIDTPMHDECVHFALQVCPYLAVPSWSREVGLRKYQQSAGASGVLTVIDPTMIPGRPPVFVAVMAVGQRFTDGNGYQQFVRPARPYRKIEFWRHGQRLAEADGLAACADDTGYSPAQLRALARSDRAAEPILYEGETT
jgi:hypothetical protein